MSTNTNLTRRELLKGILVIPASAALTNYSFAGVTKANFTTCALGHNDHGKTTLTAALVNVAANKNLVSYENVNAAKVNNINGIQFKASSVHYETAKRIYTHLDCPSHFDHIKNLIAGEKKIDGALLVVSLSDGTMPQTREHILLARKVGITKFIVFLNKKDLVAENEFIQMEDEFIQMIEEEVQELLSEYDYSKDDVRIISGSALTALQEGATAASDIGTRSVQSLLNAMDEHFPDPIKNVDKLSKAKTLRTFSALVYILAKDEGGRDAPFFKGYRPNFSLRTLETELSGEVMLPAGVEMVMPGDNLQIKVELDTPMAVHSGQRFIMKEGSKTIGAGIITSLESV